jgi:CheY-like chemotaxis protein
MTSNLRILLAEDNEVNQHLIMRILARIGYEVTLAKNGIQVLNKMDKQDFDLILMDIQMPEMDGITATKLIRAHYSAEKQPRIVALTAEVPTEGIDKYKSAGMDGVLTKPVQIEELVAVLESFSKNIPVKKHEEIQPENKSSSLNDFQTLDQNVIGDFMKLMGDDTDSARHLIDLYKQGTPELIEKIETAFKQKNMDDLLRLMHTLKGSSSQVGARRMEQLCARLEVLLKQSGIEPFGNFISGIKQEFSAVVAALDDFAASWK